MPTALCVTAPLLLAVVLVVSALGKLRDPERSRAAFTAMGVPAWLDRPWVAKAHPWAEIALAALLLVTPGPVGVVVAAAALVLMLVYVALVVRALRMPVDVDCACFGSIGGERVTAGTVWRNLWLTALAVVTVTCAVEGTSVASRVGALDAAAAWWLGAVLASALTVALIVVPPKASRGRAAEAEAPDGHDVEGEDYLRQRTPAVPVTLADGTVTDLRSLSRERPQLLIWVRDRCVACAPTIDAVPGWRRRLPLLDVRLMVKMAHDQARLASTSSPMTLHDPKGLVRDTFGLDATAAVLLGADGFVAGGPVTGAEQVVAFVHSIEAELREAGAIR